jgi:hypothetical protein
MREKVERDAPARAKGAVRLTEFDADRNTGFIGRLEKETTSFFFTNFRDETQAVELWALFAKHGRVGEVYIPNKRDKRGNRFGFVRFKEVKNVEAFSARLEDVWVGMYKVRINLTRFARKSPNNSPKTKKQSPSQAMATSSGPFKRALLEGRKAQDDSAVASVEVEVNQEVMHSLEGSYVGRLSDGVELRALQTKLWLSGLHSITVVVMGGDLVLISNSSGEEVRGPITQKGWWGGLLFGINRWTPNMVYSKRELWVNMRGIPLHVWGEATFRVIANRCGRFLTIDSGTKNRSRLDVARVKIEAPLLGSIDYSFKLVVQGAFYWVRVVEEGGFMVEKEEAEDQLHPADEFSSCASGGKAAAIVVVDVLGDDDTESETSEEGQCEVTVGVQKVNNSMGAKGCERVGGEMTGEGSGRARLIPSIESTLKGTDEEAMADTPVFVRGSTSLEGVGRTYIAKGGHLSNSNVLCSLTDTTSSQGHVGLGSGHVGVMENYTCPIDVGRVEDEAVDPDPVRDVVIGADPAGGPGLVGPLIQDVGKEMGLGPVINALENKIIQTRVNLEGGGFCTESSESITGGSPLNAQHIPSASNLQIGKSKNNKHRKPIVPLTSFLGPKCMRFAGVVNSSRRGKGGLCSSALQESKGSSDDFEELEAAKEVGDQDQGAMNTTRKHEFCDEITL